MRRISGLTAALLLSLVLARSPVARAIDITGTWDVCLHCTFGILCGDGYDVWTFTQTGDTFALTAPSLPGVPYTGTIDPTSGAFVTDPNVVLLTGTATQTSLAGTYESLALGTFNARRSCDPLTPDACDDGDACTVDTCAATGIPPCDASLPATTVDVCTHEPAPECTTTTVTTSTTTTTLPPGHFPVEGAKLVVRRSFTSGKAKVVFVTKDPSLGFPPFGDPSDPRSAGSGGVVIDLLSQSEGVAVPQISIPAGDPRWRTKSTPPSYRFKNRSAPADGSGVRKLVLLEGRKLKVSAAEHALVLLDPQLAVGIRVTMGQYQTCAKFSAASIRKDGVGVFVARSAAAPVDCSNASLFGP